MLTEIDNKTLAYVNLYAILGTLEHLCELVPEAKALLQGKPPIAIGFVVKNGPSATLIFKDGHCKLKKGCDTCTIRLPFSSCEKFNGLLSGSVTPIPSKGFTKLSFLLQTFVPLSKLLERYLKPTKENLKDPVFAKISTMLTLYTVASAISQVGNHDKSGKFSASWIADGDISVEIADEMGCTIRVKNHRLTTIKSLSENSRAIMRFSSFTIARQLFHGEVSSMACICDGSIAMLGMVNMIDNVNRILDRVNLYLNS